ncbi:MAG: hypothetical protein Q9226_002144 [Calogaya cf. arnoldii]
MNHIAPAANLTSLKSFLGLDSHGAGQQGPVYHYDTLFLAIDFEGREDFAGVSQIGMSILDTRGLPYASLLGQTLIETQLYCVAKRSKHRRLDKNIKRVFTLGEVSWITREERVSALVTIFQQCNSYSIMERNATLSQFRVAHNALTGPRNIVLVGHGLETEMRNMDLLGFRLEEHANIVAYVDTRTLSYQVHGVGGTLHSIARQVGLCPRRFYTAGAHPKARHFHVAGNDTAYILETLFLLLVREHEQAVNNSMAGWVGLTRMSAAKAISSASSQLAQDSDLLRRRKWWDCDQDVSRNEPPSKRAMYENSETSSQSTNELLLQSPGPCNPSEQPCAARGIANIAPAFLLAAGRWQMVNQTTGKTKYYAAILEDLDAQAQATVGSVAYNTAICAMPLYFALAPPWHITSIRV